MTVRASAAAAVCPRSGPVRAAYGRWHEASSLVCWASGTKVLTAALARTLVADGTVDWETPVGDLLDSDTPAVLTVAALVEHRSGLPRALPEQGPAVPDPYVGWTTARFDEHVLPRLPELAARGTPGEIVYSNVGYAVLARALETGLGASWLDLVRDRVIAPLGLPPDTVTVAPPEGTGHSGVGRALASRNLRGRPVPEWDTSTGPFAAAGGLCSTVPAMVQILRSSLDVGGPVSPTHPGGGPHAWERQGTRAWHAGALMRSGSLLVVDTGTGTVAASHVLGGLPGHGATYAEKALNDLLSTPVASVTTEGGA